METFLLSYDLKATIPDPRAAFVAKAALFGWRSWIAGIDGSRYVLPNATLIGSFSSMEAARQALDEAAIAAERRLDTVLTIEKFVIVAYTTARLSSDTREPPGLPPCDPEGPSLDGAATRPRPASRRASPRAPRAPCP